MFNPSMSDEDVDDKDDLFDVSNDNIAALCAHMVSDIITFKKRQRNEHVVTEDLTGDNSLFKDVLGNSLNIFDQFLDMT